MLDVTRLLPEMSRTGERAVPGAGVLFLILGFFGMFWFLKVTTPTSDRTTSNNSCVPALRHIAGEPILCSDRAED